MPISVVNLLKHLLIGLCCMVLKHLSALVLVFVRGPVSRSSSALRLQEAAPKGKVCKHCLLMWNTYRWLQLKVRCSQEARRRLWFLCSCLVVWEWHEHTDTSCVTGSHSSNQSSSCDWHQGEVGRRPRLTGTVTVQTNRLDCLANWNNPRGTAVFMHFDNEKVLMVKKYKMRIWAQIWIWFYLRTPAKRTLSLIHLLLWL